MMAELWRRAWGVLVTYRWRLLVLFGAVLLPLYAFGELADEVWEGERIAFDAPLLDYARASATPALDTFMLVVTRLGYLWGVVPVTTLTLIVLWRRAPVRDTLFFALSVLGATLLNQAAKLLFARERPALWPSLVNESSFSFPSGHAMGSMALAAALVVLLWPTRWRYPALVGGGLFTLLVGVSRVYLGVHYPSDVLAGWIAALAWVVGLTLLLYRPGGATRERD